jgi:hypothetical protein
MDIAIPMATEATKRARDFPTGVMLARHPTHAVYVTAIQVKSI